jgi:monoterpene epsilon-lactone hydrolase
MASWQAGFLQAVLRWMVKRKAHLPIDPVETRRKVRGGRLSRKLLSRINGFRAGAVNGDQVAPAPWLAPNSGLGVLYLHGGGYFFCSPQTHRPMTLGLATRLKAPVWAPDYRLAPENPYPAALDDALATYRHLLETEPARQWVLAGDSAGGGLCLALAGRIRSLDLRTPLALLLYSPWTDLTCSGASLVTNDRSCSIFSAQSVRFAASLYPGPTAPGHPEISPLFADLTGLPPMLVFAANEEALLDDSTRLVERARASGVEVQFERVGGVPHAWPVFQRLLPEGREAMRISGEFVDLQITAHQADGARTCPATVLLRRGDP